MKADRQTVTTKKMSATGATTELKIRDEGYGRRRLAVVAVPVSNVGVVVFVVCHSFFVLSVR